MSIGRPHESSVLLTQSLLWNRELGGPPRPQPVVVLLGPVGSGKTTALKSISEACGNEVVHALVDFHHDDPAPPTTVDTLARVAFDLSCTWKARPRARFTRFALGLIAVQTSREEHSREQAKDTLRVSIEAFTRNRRADRVVAGLVVRLVDSAKNAGVLPALAAEITKAVLPQLIRTAARQPVSKAMRWHASFPEAENATPLDALVSLSRTKPPEITDWLTAAFLADIRESHPRMATPDRLSRCSCPNPDQARHWHNWVLLLDNIDHPAGARFVTDLIAARKRHLRRHPDEHDALLVVATSGRWDSHWESGWRAPWHSPLENTGRARTVRLCREANYGHWADQASEAPQYPYYPVLLEPLTIDETARILGSSPRAPECILAQHATGGLPAAVHLLTGLRRDRQFRPGARDVLGSTDPARPGADPWHERLASLRLARHLPDIGIDEFVAAAPFATAPWLIPHNATSLISRPHVGRILTELRTALWSTTLGNIAPENGSGTPNYGALHPWIARTLVSALARRDTAPSYPEQFEALLNDPDTFNDPVRKAYCQLALGRIGEVVDAFEASFDQGPHQDWIDRLKLVTRAPDDHPLDRDCGELYKQLVTTNVSKTPHDRSPANTITRLITASWLAANPFAMPDPALRDVIAHAYQELPPLSRRPDVAALYEAARLAADPPL
ncbi:MAG: hypothetical protein ACRDR6_05640 [Pseudonocardiaceae bacterium]